MRTQAAHDREPLIEVTSRMAGRRALAARLGWSTFDQALSSGTNFLLTVLVARALAPRDFGAFGLAYASYMVLLGIGRAVAAEPLLVRSSAAEPAAQRAAFAAASGASAVAGAVFGAGCLAVGVTVGGTVGSCLVVLGIAMPGLFVQDAWRYCFFCGSVPKKAVINDAVWAVAQLLLVVAVLGGGATAPTLLAAWAAAAVIAAIVGAIQARTLPEIRAAWSWVKTHRDVTPGFAVDCLAKQASPQLALYVVAATAGLPAVAAVRASQALFGPLRVFYVSMTVVAIPEVVRLRGDRRMSRSIIRVSAALATVGALASLVVVATPTSLGREILGATWPLARPLLPFISISTIALGASVGPIVALRGHEAVRQTAQARVSGLVLTLIGATVGGAIAGPLGAAVGLAAGAACEAGIWWSLWLTVSRALTLDVVAGHGTYRPK